MGKLQGRSPSDGTSSTPCMSKGPASAKLAPKSALVSLTSTSISQAATAQNATPGIRQRRARKPLDYARDSRYTRKGGSGRQAASHHRDPQEARGRQADASLFSRATSGQTRMTGGSMPAGALSLSAAGDATLARSSRTLCLSQPRGRRLVRRTYRAPAYGPSTAAPSQALHE